MATIPGYIHFCQVRKPGLKWESTEKHWSVQVEVSEKEAKKFKKNCPASKDAIKEFTAEEFRKQFKCDPQVVKPSEDSEHLVIRIKQDCVINGEPWATPPNVFIKNDNGKLENITNKVDVANGSEGVVQYSIFESKKWKTKSAKLVNVLITNLIEYTGGGADVSELGELEEDQGLRELEDLEDDDAPFDTDEDDDDSDDY
jgi:hypothetical protein